MKTDDLIAMLAREVPAVDRRVPARRYVAAVLIGAAGALLLMAGLLGLRPDIAEAVRQPMFWLRMGYGVTIGAAAFTLLTRLARPGTTVGSRWATVAAPIAAAWAGAAAILARTAADERVAVWLGHTWKVCPILIAILSVPAFAAMMWAVRGMAPVRPRWAGAATGLFAGATAVVAYGLHCPEMAPPFWAFWYLVGMLIPAAAGALLGRRLLRW